MLRAFAAALIFVAVAAPALAAAPNVVFLISDDHSWPHLGCYGDSVVHTPNLDRLAAEGIRFDNAFVTSPQCTPSRSSIVTGRTPHSTGTSRLHSTLREEYVSVVDLLKSAGYHTGGLKKHHLGPDFRKRFDFYDNELEFEKFFAQRPTEKPFFLWVGFVDPHRDYEQGAFDPPHDPARVKVPSFLPDTPEVRRDVALYYDEIARMDADCGRLLALLEQHGVADNTLVFFLGDNGMPFPGAKGSLYDPGIHVPLLARWPGRIKPGRSSDEMVSLMDLMPTALAAAGAEIPPLVQARSILPVLLDQPYQSRELVFAERNHHDNLDLIRAVRSKRWKLIRNFRPEIPYRPTLDLERSPSWQAVLALRDGGRLDERLTERYFRAPRPEFELYDLQADREETRNLASDPAHQKTLRELQQRLGDWMEQTNDFLPASLPRQQRRPAARE